MKFNEMVSSHQVSDIINDTSLNNIIVILTAVILYLVVVYYKIVSRRKISLAKRIPGPDGFFFVGMLPVLLGGPEKLLKNILKVGRKYQNTLCKAWILDQLYVFPGNPEEIEAILTNPNMFNKAKLYNVASESIMGDGLFTNRVFDEWKNNRKLVATGFKFSMLKSFIPIFYEEAKFLSQVLYEKRDINTNECEISCAIGMATMEIIGRTALGVKFNTQKNAKHVFLENLHFIKKAMEYRVTHPWFLNRSLFQLSTYKRKHDISQNKIYNFIDDLVQRKKTELRNRINSQGEHNEECMGLKCKSFIEILLENEHQMSFQQLRDEIITTIIGGQDTTAMAIACSIFMLAHHQDIQNKVCYNTYSVLEELLTLFSTGDPDRQPTYEDLQKMDYLERVIKETLRHFPSFPFFGRNVEKETVIGGYLIPAGSTFIICTQLLHLNANFYPEPEKFNPDNFLPEACRSRHPYSFLPFSGGYRNCIGMKYAMLQIKAVVSTLVRSYRFSPSDKCPKPENLRLTYAGTQAFVDGCYVKIEERT
ncbi:cytochrome P450 4C1-like isoform X3 [Adelges cooleyi]|uniref:cytochrome P450 4C1-like isoform X3 n=1 Tax=Adelges cooleyi TaxID=133065 RepID=UPI00217F40F6|nr:cytochrome P450 4C1-like isoform X3 [Adelges cooleyi]